MDIRWHDRFSGGAAARIGQPPVVGQLIGGLLAGPSRLFNCQPNWNRVMSILPLLVQSAFEPETIDSLVAVFEAAWRKVELSGSKLASPAYKRAAQEILAKRIIEMAQGGERDADRLADDAVNYLERSYA